MGRPIEFDKEIVLERAMSIFWTKGYASTSITDLVISTGMTTRSMYNVFGSKNGIFKAVIQKYQKTGFEQLTSRLKKTQGIESIREFISLATDSSYKNGCLLVNTVSEGNIIEKDCSLIVEKHFQNLENIIRSKLKYAKEKESFRGDVDITTQQIIVFIQGLAMYGKMHGGQKKMKKIGEKFLEQLGM